MATIVEGAPLELTRLHRQQRCCALKGLNPRLFVDTEDHRMLRRIDVQPDDVAHLVDQPRARRQLERLGPVRLEAEGPPDPTNVRLAQSSTPRHGAGTPVGGPARGRFQGAQHHAFDLRVRDPARRARARLIDQAGDAVEQESGAPLADRGRGHVQALGDAGRGRWAKEVKALRSSSVTATGVWGRPLRREYLVRTERTMLPNSFTGFTIRTLGTHKQVRGRELVGEAPGLPRALYPDFEFLMVERFLADLTQDCVRAGNFVNVAELVEAITVYLAVGNENSKPYAKGKAGGAKTLDQDREGLGGPCDGDGGYIASLWAATLAYLDTGTSRCGGRHQQPAGVVGRGGYGFRLPGALIWMLFLCCGRMELAPAADTDSREVFQECQQ